MNESFYSLVLQRKPSEKSGTQIESLLKKINVSRAQLAELIGVEYNTLCRKLNPNSKNYKSKTSANKKGGLLYEWALVGVQSVIDELKRQASEVEEQKIKNAESIIKYAEGTYNDKHIITAEKRINILDAIHVHGDDISSISKAVGLSRKVVLKHICKDEELLEEFRSEAEHDVIEGKRVLREIMSDSAKKDSDRIKSVQEIFKTTPSKLLDKSVDDNFNRKSPSFSFIVNATNDQDGEKKKMKEARKTITDENGQEILLFEDEDSQG